MARNEDFNENDPNYIAGKELYRQLSKHLNNMSAGEKFCQGYFDALTQDHRTLQQAYGRFAVKILLKYAKLDPHVWCDQRNQAFSKLCKEITPSLENNHLPVI